MLTTGCTIDNLLTDRRYSKIEQNLPFFDNSNTIKYLVIAEDDCHKSIFYLH